MLTLTCNRSAAITLFIASAMTDEPLIFPTDTIYGIGAPITSVVGNNKIFTLKDRPMGQPLPILVGSWEQAKQVADISFDLHKRLEKVWPGPFTIILPALETVAQSKIYTHNQKIALRMPKDLWLRDAIQAFGSPITATSINLHGEPPLLKPEIIYEKFKKSCKYMLWGESGDKPSSIIDFTEKEDLIIRNPI